MADKHYFTVSSDIGGRDEYICESFEEAREYLSTVTGWDGPGGGAIKERDKYLRLVRSWHYSQNKEISRYDYFSCQENKDTSKND